jgi:hypothetical protein
MVIVGMMVNPHPKTKKRSLELNKKAIGTIKDIQKS